MAQQLDPSFSITYRYLGQVHQNMGDLGDAITELKHAYELDPRDQTTFQLLQNAEAALASRR